MVPTAIFLLFSYITLSQQTKDDYAMNRSIVINGIDNNLDVYFRNIKTLSLQIFSSSTIQRLLNTKGSRTEPSVKSNREFSNYIYDLLQGRSDIGSISIYGVNGEHYLYDMNHLYNATPSDESVVSVLESEGDSFYIYGARQQKNAKNDHKRTITVGRKLKSFENGDTIGYLVINIDYVSFSKIISASQLTQKDIIYLISPDDHIIYSSNDSNTLLKDYKTLGQYKEITNNRNATITDIQSQYFDWHYLVMNDNETLLKQINKILNIYLLVGSLIVVSIVLFSIVITKIIVKPVNRLEKAMQSASNSNYNEIVPAFGSFDEINHLAQYYNVMLVEIQRLLEKINENNRKQNEAELKALQLQITPHFLYNSLDSINCLAQIHGDQAISEMILSLSRVFQYNMRYDSDSATLSDEIEHVQNYCRLQAVNYQDNFKITYDIPNELTKTRVVKFMLQPIVENAIYHGVKHRKGGLIRIWAYDKDECLYVCVSDNGINTDKETVDSLNSTLNLSSEDLFKVSKNSQHIGLINVDLRIKLQYGDTYGVLVEMNNDVGMIVIEKLPIMQ